MSGDICYLCFDRGAQMKYNFQESVQNSNIMDFVDHFCQFVFQDNSVILEEVCMKCWQTIQQFSQFCLKIRGVHQNLVDETNTTGIDKIDLRTEVLEDVEEDPLDDYDIQKTLPMLAIDANLDDETEAEHFSRRTEMTPKMVASLNEQLKFEAKTIDLAQVEFERFARFIPMECTACKFQFDSFEEFQDHFVFIHNRSAVWNCCNLTLDTPYDALDHMKYHESIDVFKCAACFKCFLTSNKLKYHIRRTHLPVDEGQFECIACDKKCKNLRLLLNHQKSHIQIVCMVCKKHISASNYDQHVRSVHVTALPSKKRKSANKNDESNKKTKINEQSTPTSSSSSTSNKPSNVPAHKKIMSRTFVNTEPNPNGMFECDICRMEFKQLSLVYSHRNKVHV